MKGHQMFGYVMLNPRSLKKESQEKYRSFYCGLCRNLRSRYGLKGQAVLTYDMTFLNILFSSLYEPEDEKITTRCIFNKLREHEVLTNKYTDYCADMNMLLSYYRSVDEHIDGDNPASGLMLNLFKSYYEKLRIKYPQKVKVIDECMEKINIIEHPEVSEYLAAADRMKSFTDIHKTSAENEGKGFCITKDEYTKWMNRAYSSIKVSEQDDGCPDIDSAASAFGHITEEIFAIYNDEWTETLRRMGYNLGRFIYLVDAYDDVEKDVKKKEYNPFSSIFKKDDFEDFCDKILTMTMELFSKDFETLPLINNVDILRNIVYSGVWLRYAMKKEKNIGKKRKE
jgi:hypothetical protein